MLLALYFLGLIYKGGARNEKPVYPVDSMDESGSLFPIGGDPLNARVHNTVVYSDNFIIVYGGYSVNRLYLSDVSIYDLKYQSWSGVITRLKCCNTDSVVVETLGIETSIDTTLLRSGFEGDTPVARAEHAAVVIDKLMYVFGGNSRLGLLNDFYFLDLKSMNWHPIRHVHSSVWPSRRAGHNLIIDGKQIYLFGGRVYTKRDESSTEMSSSNDVWKYDPLDNSWAHLSPTNENQDVPLGRQFSAVTVAFESIWIFGGMDAKSRQIYNDVWCFSLNSLIWTQVVPNSGSIIGFAPPPLYLSHLLPVARNRSSQDRSFTMLVYGGVGSGGSCGSRGDLSDTKNTDNIASVDFVTTHCQPKQLVFGQVYRLEVRLGTWDSPRLRTPSTEPDETFVMSSTWKYARLSSAQSNQVNEGKFRKLYGFESVTYSSELNLLYEVGGLTVNVHNEYTSDLASANQVARGFDEPLSVSAGGLLGSPLWDLVTGEFLRHSVDIPANARWDFIEGFTSLQPLNETLSNVSFLNSFKIYSMSAEDVVLLYDS